MQTAPGESGVEMSSTVAGTAGAQGSDDTEPNNGSRSEPGAKLTQTYM